MLQIFAIFYLPGLLIESFRWPAMNTGWEWFDTTFSSRFIAALVAFGINYAAYFSEIFRGGIQSIAQGQYEAGQVLGMTKRETFFKVILLQVIKRIIPPMSNEIITLVKDMDALAMGGNAGVFAAGVIASFISGLLAIKLLTYISNKHSFKSFAYYCIGIGVVAIVIDVVKAVI